MNIERDIIAHYAETPDLALRLIALAGGAAGITAEKLAPYDEMHVGGYRATEYLLAALGLRPEMRVLDIGCGVGGAARMAALRYGAKVTGIDLTPDYCLVATMLSELTGQGDMVSFEAGNATAMKFAEGMFDAAYTIHAAMNIENKRALYAEAFRVLKAGARFGIYDVMRGTAAEPCYPLPWASDAGMSFPATPEEVVTLLEEAGFTVAQNESRDDFARGALAKMIEKEGRIRNARATPDFAQRIRNLYDAVGDGALVLRQIIAVKAGV